MVKELLTLCKEEGECRERIGTLIPFIIGEFQNACYASILNVEILELIKRNCSVKVATRFEKILLVLARVSLGYSFLILFLLTYM